MVMRLRRGKGAEATDVPAVDDGDVDKGTRGKRKADEAAVKTRFGRRVKKRAQFDDSSSDEGAGDEGAVEDGANAATVAGEESGEE